MPSIHSAGWDWRSARALETPPTAGAWPEVESAWADARRALQEANIDLAATPAFLIVGPLGPEIHAALESLGAAKLPLPAEAPLQAFARPGSIFIAFPEGAPAGIEPDQTPLHDLCRLLVHDRALRRPLQGIIVMAPFDAESTAAVGDSWRRHLLAIRRATGLELPIHFAITGVNPADGCLLRFPPLPDLDPAEIAMMYQLGVDWLCLERIPQQLRAGIRLESTALADNLRLYRQQSALAKWRTRFAQMLGDATQTDDAEPGMVAGCFVVPAAATALQADLLAQQNIASWTAATIQQHRAQTWRVRLGYALGLLALFGAAWIAASPW